ncbi:unnamed protein product [Linum trigynum]|uniref:Uncharacterized protein n=1 Tax=Linum trigynum TaxID=586398 RepID=A0AAV2GLB8_9ROSI
MTRSQLGGLLPLDPELERTCCQLRREQRTRPAKEEVHVVDHLSSNSEEEYEMGNEHNMGNLNLGQNQILGMPVQVPPLNLILENNAVPQADGAQHPPPSPGPTMKYYYTPRVADFRPVILYPPIPANNFEIKPCWIQLITSSIQFHG